jgi:MSHA pilin protein MshC
MWKQRGFTMIELIVVMIIIGILAVVVLPRFDLLKGFDEIGYRDKVKATLEYARKSAVAGRRYVCVSRSGSNLILTRNLSDPDSLTLATAACPADADPNRLGLPTVDARYCASGTAANQICAPTGVTLGGTAPTSLLFSPLGQSTGGTYTIVASGTTTITVVAETGYVY